MQVNSTYYNDVKVNDDIKTKGSKYSRRSRHTQRPLKIKLPNSLPLDQYVIDNIANDLKTLY